MLRAVIFDFNGVLVADGYGAYDKAARAGDIDLAICWAHARRKLVGADYLASPSEQLG